MKRISGILYLCIFVLLAGFFTPAKLVSAGNEIWSAETIPNTINKVLGPPGIDICDIAARADGSTIYAVCGDSISDNIVYKSSDAGINWTTLDADIVPNLIAAAPDDSSTIVIANNNTARVNITFNGGITWHDLGIPQEGGAAAAAICDISISPAINGIRYIAAAGRQAGDNANVWYYSAGAIPATWKQTSASSGFNSADEAAAVAFSPSFASDKIMAAITVKNAGPVMLQVFNYSNSHWNDSPSFAGYPVTITSGAGIAGLYSASLSFSPDYSADDPDYRNIFIGLTINGDAAAAASSGIYLLRNDRITALKTGTNIHSIVFNGTNLIAGSYSNTTVYRSTNPLVETPVINSVSTMKGPGGVNRTVVAWAGNKVVAGTSGKESALAISTDNGTAFNDISLIDTVLSHIRDAAASSDGSRVYLVSDDGTDLSVWRKDATWERILSRQGTTDYMARLAPEDDDVIYIARKGGTTIYQSKNGGKTTWAIQMCSLSVQDLAVTESDIAYAISFSGSAAKTTNAGFTWGAPKPTSLNNAATIVSASLNNLLAGSQDGYVAYSTDGNLSWTKINEALASGAGKVQVAADKDFKENNIIYAASDTAGQGIKKWQIGVSNAWTNILTSTPGGFYGMAVYEDTLYALEFNTSTKQSNLWYLLSPAEVTNTSSVWSSSATTDNTDADNPEIWFNAPPQALKASLNKVWAVKTNGVNKLYSFSNTPPVGQILKPTEDYVNHVNVLSGIASDMIFSWLRPHQATAYELQIALDKNFKMLLASINFNSDKSTVVILVGPHQTGTAMVNFPPGTICYWRERTTRPGFGAYSKVNSFRVEPVPAAVPVLLSPLNGSSEISRKPAFSWRPQSGTTEYQFMLSDNTDMTAPRINVTINTTAYAVDDELEYGQTYFWQVRAVKPAATAWSTLANFSVAAKPPEQAEPVPPVIVSPAPTPVFVLPYPAPGTELLFPPPANPKYVMPGYLYAGIIIEGTLLLMVIMLIINRLIFKPIYIPWFFMGKPEKRKEKPSTSFKINLSLKPFTSRSIHTGEDPGKKTMKNDEKPVVSSIDIASLPPVTEAKKRTAEDLNPEPIPTTSDVTIGVSLNNPIVKTGDTRIVSILVESKIELRGARCSLTFDPSLVKCNRVGEGNYFKYWTDAHRGSTQINPQPIIDNDKGLVSDIGIFIKGSPRRGFKGNGVLCYYSFTAIASGTLKPTLSNVSVIDKSGKIFLSEIKSR